MAQPLPYERDYDFTSFQVRHATTPPPGNKLDREFDQIAATIEEVLSRIAILQRDDLQLANSLVGYDQLKPELRNGFTTPTVWATGKKYAIGASIYVGPKVYAALVAHTSGVFATDLTAGKWHLLADFTIVAGAVQTAVDAAAAAVGSATEAAASAFTAATAAMNAQALLDTIDVDDVTTLAGISADVTAAAANAADISTVAGISGDVSTVAGIAADVATAAELAADVSAVAAIADEIVAVPAQVQAAEAAKVAAEAARDAARAAVGITLEQFGAKNDGNTPDDDAWDAAYAWCMAQPNGGTIRLLPGSGYRLNASHNIHPTKRLGLHWENGAKVLCGLTGAGSVLLDASHPTVPGTRGTYLIISGNSEIRAHSATAGQILAKYFKYRHASGMKVDGSNHSWLHYGNNSMFEITAPFNCDLGPMTFWGGGHRKPRKSTGNALFSIASAGTTLTSDIDIFEAGDVGDIICTYDETFTISAFTNAKTVTVTEAASRAVVSQRGSYGSAMATGTAASGAVTLSASVAVASDVGRDVYIMDAANSTGSAKALHKAVITAVGSGTSITVDPVLEASVTNAEIIFSPTAVIWHDAGTIIADIVWEGFHVEEFKGTGLVTGHGVQVSLPEIKLHGHNLAYNTAASDYCAVFSRTQLVANGIAEGTVCGRLGRIVCTGQTASVLISDLQGIAMRKMPFVHARHLYATAEIVVGDITVNSGLDVTTMDRAVTKAGTAGTIELTGKFRNNENTIVQPYAVGTRVKRSAIPTGTQHHAGAGETNPAYAIFGGMGGTGTPAFRGVGLGGTPDAPTGTGDFQSVGAFEAWGMAPSASAPVILSRIVATARGVSGANIGGELTFQTKLAAGALTSRWQIAQSGELIPMADNTYNLGWSGGRVANAHITTLQATNLTAGGTGVGFFGTAQQAKPTVTGAKGGNAALTSLLTQLATLGLITDSTT